MVGKFKKSNNMKKIFFCLLFFIALIWLFSACTVQLNTLNQKTIKKCSACEKFLKEDKVYEASYREYDGGVQHFYSLDHLKVLNKFEIRRKANFMDFSDWQRVLNHTFCFNGMKKAEVESKFGKSLDKYSGSRGGKIIEDWETVYNFKVGALNKDSAVCLILGSILFDYEVVNEDTLYKPLPSDIQRLKKCLDADGVKYKE